MPKYAQIIIEFAKVESIDRAFTYAIPDELQEKIQLGSRVKVSFGVGKQFQIGYVIGFLETLENQNYKIKSIVGLVDEEPLLSKEQLEIAFFLNQYYASSLAMSIQTVLPPGITSKPMNCVYNSVENVVLTQSPELAKQYIEENQEQPKTKRQCEVLKYLLAHRCVAYQDLIDFFKAEFKVQSTLQTLMKKGWVEKRKSVLALERSTIREETFQTLNLEQRVAYEEIQTALTEQTYQVILLEGVTGSGKTEVFLHSIKEVVRKGGQVIVLVPEIALTRQTLMRFRERFGNQVELTHSRMTPKERQILYLKAKRQEISIIIGPRSAIFMPFPNLKLIVIDEEHDSSYKSSEAGPKYHAIEVAKMRMKYHQGVVLLASATPSLETYYAATTKKYHWVKLTQRAGGAKLPTVHLVDMRVELAKGNREVISEPLYEAIKKALSQGEQVMILLNRRGHSTFVNCRKCGYVMKCPHCNIPLTYHLTNKTLTCHYCGESQGITEVCPSCGSSYIRYFGNGTQKVEEYLNRYFKEYGIGRMDLDTTSGKEGHSRLLSAFENREFNILIGTQMIAKGHDFPNVTVVGIVAADASLYGQDFRSSEKTFQLITQTLGRSGRAQKSGEVFIQTYNPEEAIFQRIKTFQQDLFYEEELGLRRLMFYPPFSHLFAILLTGQDEVKLIRQAQGLAEYCKHFNKKNLFRIVGPASATLGKLADEYRWRILILGEEREKLLIYGKYCIDKFCKYEAQQAIKIQWDIDPMNMI